ncbi:MAG: hypothetical protein K8T10_04830 [Candidatus Eremiobacteraeota bacterium]|nr:hypothetical protein [Candidatus Eremiobacteraeota bacterium]
MSRKIHVTFFIVLLMCALMFGFFSTEVQARTQKRLSKRTRLRPVNWRPGRKLWFAAGNYWIDDLEKGVQSGTLDQTVTLKIWNSKRSVSFGKGFIRFERGGGVKKGVLARDTTLYVVNRKRQIKFMGGKSVEFGWDGGVMKGTVAQGTAFSTSLIKRGGGTKTFPKGTRVTFNGAGVPTSIVAPSRTTTSGRVRTLFKNHKMKPGESRTVKGGGTSPRFVLKYPCKITRIMTYHFNNMRGSPIGTIALRSASGKVYGPWKVERRPGFPIESMQWSVDPNVVIPAGTYTVIDSNPGTWSQNSASRGHGMTIVNGIRIK